MNLSKFITTKNIKNFCCRSLILNVSILLFWVLNLIWDIITPSTMVKIGQTAALLGSVSGVLFIIFWNLHDDNEKNKKRYH